MLGSAQLATAPLAGDVLVDSASGSGMNTPIRNRGPVLQRIRRDTAGAVIVTVPEASPLLKD